MAIYALQICVCRGCLCKDIFTSLHKLVSTIHVHLLPVLCHSFNTIVSRQVGEHLGWAHGRSQGGS